MSRIAVLAAGSGALAVVLGAFGAHALRNVLDAASLQTWHTAVEYQFWHTLALLAAACRPLHAGAVRAPLRLHSESLCSAAASMHSRLAHRASWA